MGNRIAGPNTIALLISELLILPNYKLKYCRTRFSNTVSITTSNKNPNMLTLTRPTGFRQYWNACYSPPYSPYR